MLTSCELFYTQVKTLVIKKYIMLKKMVNTFLHNLQFYEVAYFLKKLKIINARIMIQMVCLKTIHYLKRKTLTLLENHTIKKVFQSPFQLFKNLMETVPKFIISLLYITGGNITI